MFQVILYVQEKFEDNKGVITNSKSKGRQVNDQQKTPCYSGYKSGDKSWKRKIGWECDNDKRYSITGNQVMMSTYSPATLGLVVSPLVATLYLRKSKIWNAISTERYTGTSKTGAVGMYVVVLIVFSELRWAVIVRFVDIGGIDSI